MKKSFLLTIILLVVSSIVNAQDSIVAPQVQDESKLKISGELQTDDDFTVRKLKQ